MTQKERLVELSKLSPVEILNAFRNRYYTDGNGTENGIVANAINDVLPKLIVPTCNVKENEMTTEEKIKALKNFCYGRGCSTCPLENFKDCGFIYYDDDDLNEACAIIGVENIHAERSVQ